MLGQKNGFGCMAAAKMLCVLCWAKHGTDFSNGVGERIRVELSERALRRTCGRLMRLQALTDLMPRAKSVRRSPRQRVDNPKPLGDRVAWQVFELLADPPVHVRLPGFGTKSKREIRRPQFVSSPLR